MSSSVMSPHTSILSLDSGSLEYTPAEETLILILKGRYIRDKQTLFSVACALAGNAMGPVALDALWHEMNSLVPLMKLIPAFKESAGVYVSFKCTASLHHLASSHSAAMPLYST